MKHAHHKCQHDHDGDVGEHDEEPCKQVDPTEDEDERDGAKQADGQGGEVRVHQPAHVHGGETHVPEAEGALKQYG